jgi:predicted ArsR family transcriptional regulator
MQRSEVDEQLHAATQPIRREILSSLAEADSYANKLADVLKLNPKVVQFHLSMLEKYDLVVGKFGLETPPSGRPVAVKYYTLTRQGRELIDFVRHWSSRKAN